MVIHRISNYTAARVGMLVNMLQSNRKRCCPCACHEDI